MDATWAIVEQNRRMRPIVVPPRPPSPGFTLIELLITVAIIGVLASIAYPSFMDSIRKSRRSDAVAALTRVQQAQERWRASHGTYTADLGVDGLKVSNSSPDGHYAIAVTANNATTYTVTAAANSSSPQASDTKCRSLQITMIDGGGVTAGLVQFGSKNSEGTLNVSSGNPCWIK